LPVVVDTNVLVSSALFPASAPGKVFDRVQLIDTILFSEATFKELQAVLNRPKFTRYLDGARRDRFLTHLRASGSFVNVRQMVQICRDPKDDKFLDVAVNGGAELIVTGDNDLLVLHPFEGVEIVTPAAYLARTCG
jgi:putative PIN family toxin of toxin-antitoxin system